MANVREAEGPSVSSQETKMPQANPVLWTRQFRSKIVLAGSGSDLSRIGVSVKFFRQPQASKNLK
jgi:hypothetical protein